MSPAQANVSTDRRCRRNLTAAESRVATAALDAHSVDDLARRDGLSRNTVKTAPQERVPQGAMASFAQLAALWSPGPRIVA